VGPEAQLRQTGKASFAELLSRPESKQRVRGSCRQRLCERLIRAVLPSRGEGRQRGCSPGLGQPWPAPLAPASRSCCPQPGLTAATAVKVVTGIWGFWPKRLHVFHAGARRREQLEGKERAAAENKPCLARMSTAQ